MLTDVLGIADVGTPNQAHHQMPDSLAHLPDLISVISVMYGWAGLELT
jgi:hypothetical protein